jgi:hypothetical protein
MNHLIGEAAEEQLERSDVLKTSHYHYKSSAWHRAEMQLPLLITEPLESVRRPLFLLRVCQGKALRSAPH